MKKTKQPENEFMIPVIVTVLTVAILGGGLYLYARQANTPRTPQPDVELSTVEVNPVDENEETPSSTPIAPVDSTMMTLYLFQQDTQVAATSDCGVTRRVARQVPRTTALADTSLKILFAEELSKYAQYQSVSITNGVARVNFASDMTPAGNPISSLSSCESQHLLSVITDTLTQYSTVNSVVLYGPQGQIQF